MKSLFETHDQDELAVQSNALIHSRQTFTLLQQRILALAVQQIDKTDSPDIEYKIRVKELIDLGSSPDIYNRLEKESRSLVKKVVTRKGVTADGKRFFQHWSMLKKAEHIEGSGELVIQFHEDIRDQLFALKGEYGPSVAIEKASCHSTYGARIYEILLDYWRFEEAEFSVEKLKFMLGLEDKYKGFTQFRRRVLRKAQKDVADNTNMKFTWEELKRAKGRGKAKKITHVKFYFTYDHAQMDMILETPKEPDFSPKFDLKKRLKNHAEFNSKKVQTVAKWLKDNPEEQKLLSDWMHQKVECSKPVDSLGNPIREMEAWAWSKIRDRIQNGGFPNADKAPEDLPGFTPDITEEKPVDDSKNPFKNMLPDFLKNR